jgi:hypothetical protein
MSRTVAVLGALWWAVLGGTALADFHSFPSASSTIVGSVPLIDEAETGWFFSVSLNHSITEYFVDSNPEIGRAIFDIHVRSNTLTSEPVEWEILINEVVIGAYAVFPEFTGPVSMAFDSPVIPALDGGYDVTMRVTNDVDFGEGAHTLAYAGPFEHAVVLIPEPATLAMLAAGLAMLRRRRC